jgi:hypothetical protein
MAKIEEAGDRLTVTVGLPKFNGCVAVFDRKAGTVQIDGKNLFFPYSKTVTLTDIASVKLVRSKGAAYPELQLASGGRIPLPSAGISDGEKVVPAIQAFLAR